MGEATFYAKARFKSKKAAKAAQPKVATFFMAMAATHDDWQQHRSDDDKAAKAFYLRNQDVLDTLGLVVTGKTFRNDFAGQLDSPAIDEGYQLTQEDDKLRFAATVWHFADWDRLCTVLEQKFGAVETAWQSDEYLDPWDCVKLESERPVNLKRSK